MSITNVSRFNPKKTFSTQSFVKVKILKCSSKTDKKYKLHFTI